MTGLRTRECTRVFSGIGEVEIRPSFEVRTLRRVDTFAQRPYSQYPAKTKTEILETIAQLQREAPGSTSNQRSQDPRPHRSPRPTRDQLVNHKRKIVAQCIMNQQTRNLKAVARHTKTSYQTVKRTYDELMHTGTLQDYTYNNTKTQAELLPLREDIQTIAEGYSTVTDLKRKHPAHSRKLILRELHAANLKWAKMPRERKGPPPAPPNPNHVAAVINQLVQAHDDPTVEVLFCDEMALPLYQTADKHWTSKTEPDTMVYNRRQVQDGKITAIALCSISGFVAVQLFKQEVTAVDFLFFLNESIGRLPQGRKYLVLADNASWHSAHLVAQSKASQFLLFNVARMFYLNLIENAFSAVRHDFRARQVVDGYEEEAELILRAFFSERNPSRFQGYYRNHLRLLDQFLNKT